MVGPQPYKSTITMVFAVWAFALWSNPSSVEAELPPQLRATEAHSRLGMVSTGSPEATAAAVGVLENGGNAVDAAVAAALALGVADSDASGIGGATYMVIRFANGRAVAIDGTPKAPGRFDLRSLQAAAEAGRTTGHEMTAVPTTLAVLDLALRKYGSIDFAEALQPAIEIADRGYSLSENQIIWTNRYYEDLVGTSNYLRYLVMADGHTVGEPGDRICNPELAQTLRTIAAQGVSAFYRGAVADLIEADMIDNGGNLRKSDLARLRVSEHAPVRTTYRGVEVLSVPSPGGGDTLIHALNILETFPSEFLSEDTLERHHVFIETARIAIADRAGSGAGMVANGFLGSNFPSKRYAYGRAQMITPGTALADSTFVGPIDPDCLPTGESTTHVSVIDARGNAVSMTQTLSEGFGAKIATPGLGFPYNNFLEAFRVEKPHCPGFLRPYAPCGNDMAPTILVDERGRVMALGTPGSNRIASILAGVISNIVDRGMNLREAIEAPRVIWGGGLEINIELEVAPPMVETYVDAFNAMSYEHPVEPVFFPADPNDLSNSGAVNTVLYDPTAGDFVGVADPRRGGLAGGPRVVAGRK